MILPLAHHPVVEALPFVAPALALPVGLAMLALRDRRRRRGVQRSVAQR